jgi:hypothetical protein
MGQKLILFDCFINPQQADTSMLLLYDMLNKFIAYFSLHHSKLSMSTVVPALPASPSANPASPTDQP